MLYEKLREKIKALAEANDLMNSDVKITARVLSNEEAIGNPEHDDYPLLKGRERLMDAEFSGCRGAAYSDMCGNFNGTIADVINLDLRNNFYRAVFISTINAVLGKLELISRTVHCRNEGPVNCARHLPDELNSLDSSTKFLLIGYQPRFAEVLTEKFNAKIVDLDPDNIGKKINNTVILSEDETAAAIDWADLLFVTSSTFVNGTAHKFIVPGKKTIFYGVSGAGPAYLLDLDRYCYQ